MTTLTETKNPIETINKRIARTIAFKDRMIALNNSMMQGKTEKELDMTVFEIEIRAREGNFNNVKTKDGREVKLFSWDLIKRSIAKVRDLRDEKSRLMILDEMGMMD